MCLLHDYVLIFVPLCVHINLLMKSGSSGGDGGGPGADADAGGSGGCSSSCGSCT